MDDSGSNEVTQAEAGDPAPAQDEPGDSIVAEVAAGALPAVVTVINEGATRVNEDGLPVETVNSGSGVIIDSAGFVLTNEHVIHNPGTLSVVLNSGEQRPAQIVSHDAPFTDLALLQIPEGGLRALPLGDSGDLVLGQTVLAIGSALFEYRNSVTTGVVSGLERRYLRGNIYVEDLIQTDAAVNTGNSGGALVTLDGRMVGLVSNVVRRVEGFENVYGISFAISTRTILPIVESMIRTGSFPRPSFGVEHLDLDVPTANEMQLASPRGALVQEVVPGGPAEEAGIQAGDIILALNNMEISPEFTFLNALALVGPNDRVVTQVLRGEEVLELSLQMVPR